MSLFSGYHGSESSNLILFLPSPKVLLQRSARADELVRGGGGGEASAALLPQTTRTGGLPDAIDHGAREGGQVPTRHGVQLRVPPRNARLRR